MVHVRMDIRRGGIGTFRNKKIVSLYGLGRQATIILYGILQLLQGSHLDNFLLKTLKKKMHTRCLQFLLGHEHVPRVI